MGFDRPNLPTDEQLTQMFDNQVDSARNRIPDSRRCWAETRMDCEYSSPCDSVIVSELGLCRKHLGEIVGNR